MFFAFFGRDLTQRRTIDQRQFVELFYTEGVPMPWWMPAVLAMAVGFVGALAFSTRE
jgi:hypothetical protein